MTSLSPDDFVAFFYEVYGCEPFPWQARLAARLAEKRAWPDVLDLPTGSGKTAAIDIAVFHLALEADRGRDRRAPVRIAFVVDRRLVVDDAFARAQRLADALAAPPGPATERIAQRLKTLAGDGPPLLARRLRGGIPREDDWARTPAQPTVLCSTVDQVGSRLLFRGYGVSDSMKPVHAGLIGSDCLILLDEAHLAEPFRQTLGWVDTYRGETWRCPTHGHAAPWGVALLTATPGEAPANRMALGDDDRSHPILKQRLDATKPAHLVGSGRTAKAEAAEDDEDDTALDGRRRAAAVAEQALAAVAKLRHNGIANPAVGVVMNRVARARNVFKHLQQALGDDAGEPILMIGPARPVDRDRLADQLASIRTGAERTLAKPLVIVATQCIEAGVDIDLDGLVTEAAPLDAMRQRFGRLNRAGRNIVPYAAIVAVKSDLSARHDDPVYGKAIKPAWDYLETFAAAPTGKGEPPIIDFGLTAFEARLAEHPAPAEALSPRSDAPVLLPAHVDLLSHTAPIPVADPEVGLYLHGPDRQPASVTVIWRADLDPDLHDDATVRRLLMTVQPLSAEAIELPLWTVQAWLQDDRAHRDRLADIPEAVPDDDPRRPATGTLRTAFRWAGDSDRSGWIAPAGLRPGDTVVVPAAYGGVDGFGWNPDAPAPATDIADLAATPFDGRRFAVRVAPGLLTESLPDEKVEDRARREWLKANALAETLAASGGDRWTDLRDNVAGLGLPVALAERLASLDHAKSNGRARKVEVVVELYGLDERGRPRGVIFVAPRSLDAVRDSNEIRPPATEDDHTGSTASVSIPLSEHCRDVAQTAARFAACAGLPEARVADIELAGALHDLGKADPRFQRWLYGGDPLGPDPDKSENILAKSPHRLSRDARVRSGLPAHWRHEALSARLAAGHPRFAEARDRDLVLWLIGTHHGQGRPFFPHHDPLDTKARSGLPRIMDLPAELPAGNGPQSLAFDWDGLDWPGLYERLKARYGVWELAHMEAVLRLADHRASEAAEARKIHQGEQA